MQLKRHASNVSDKERKAAKEKKKTKDEMDEVQLEQKESTKNGPSMPYNGPYASVGATGVVYGPTPPPSQQSKAGDSEEANIGEEDQAEIERALKESEDAGATNTNT